jgi:hypothetical protein
LLPAAQHHRHALLEDVAVLQIVGAAVGDGGDGAGELAENVGPARLVAPGEANEVFSTRDVVEDRRLLGDTDGVLRRHHVAERADMHMLHLARPPGIEDAGVGSDLVALRMQVVLDRRRAPDAHVVGRLDDVEPVE